MGQGLPGWPILPETTCMTRKTLTLILFATFAGAAAAQDSVDINGDGVLTLFEIQAVWPEVSTDGFMFLDLGCCAAAVPGPTRPRDRPFPWNLD